MGTAAAALLGIGLLLMIVPPILRDGFCGITGCADQVPVIAVSRVSADELAIVVPDEAAPLVRSVELLEGSAGSGSREWLIRRSSTDSSPSTFVMGSDPKSFRTIVALAAQPVDGVWTAQVGFHCGTASLPFDPRAVAIGQVRSWDGVMDGTEFAATANTVEHCATTRKSPEVALLVFGGMLAVLGSVLGIVVVLRRPVRFPEDPDDELGSFPDGPGDGVVSQAGPGGESDRDDTDDDGPDNHRSDGDGSDGAGGADSDRGDADDDGPDSHRSDGDGSVGDSRSDDADDADEGERPGDVVDS